MSRNQLWLSSTYALAILTAIGCSSRKPPLQAQGDNLTSSNGFSCTIAPDSSLVINSAATVQIRAVGATAPYSVVSFSTGANGTALTTPAFSGITNAVVRVSYSAVGSSTISAKISDAMGLQASCSKDVQVSAVAPTVLPEPTGYFRIGSTGYYADASKNFCRVVSSQDWVNRGAPVFDNAPTYTQISTTLKLLGDCPVVPPPPTASNNNPPPTTLPDPTSFFRVGLDRFYVMNGSKDYCQILSDDQWAMMGGPPLQNAPLYPAMPSSLRLWGQCRVPAGFFTSAGGKRFYANNEGGFCLFISDTHYLQDGGPQGPLPNYEPFPGQHMTYLQECKIWNWAYFNADGNLMLSNDQGGACRIPSITQWRAMGGPAEIPPINYPHLPNTMAYYGDCQVPTGFFTSNGLAFFSGSPGRYCSITSVSQWEANSNVALASAPSYTPFPANNMQHEGGCNFLEANLQIWRLVNERTGDYLLSQSSTEGAPKYVAQGVAFRLFVGQVAGSTPLMRCTQNTTAGLRHFASSAPDCEGGGNVPEGPLGYMYPNQRPGSVPVHRLVNTQTKGYITTADPRERQLGAPWRLQGLQGFVY